MMLLKLYFSLSFLVGAVLSNNIKPFSVKVHFKDIFISGEIHLGSPGQKLNVEFDQLCTDFWASSNEFKTGTFSKIYAPKNAFNKKKSNTFKTNEEEFESSGTHRVNGIQAEDTLTIGEFTKVVPFGLVDNYESFSNGERAADGVFGISIEKREDGKVRFLDELKLPKSIYTIYTKTADAKNSNGAITFGGEDTENCQSDFVYFPLDDLRQRTASLHSIAAIIGETVEKQWDIPEGQRKIKLWPPSWGGSQDAHNRHQMEEEAQTILGPREIVLDMYEWFQVTKKDKYGMGEIDCDESKSEYDIVLTIGDARGGNTAEWVLKPADYIIKLASGKCGFLFYDYIGSRSDWSAGNNFHRRWCTAFDFSKGLIGFGHKKPLGILGNIIEAAEKLVPF